MALDIVVVRRHEKWLHVHEIELWFVLEQQRQSLKQKENRTRQTEKKDK